MAIYRGSGGSTSTTDQATIDQVAEDAATATTKAAEAATSASSASSSASSATTSKNAAASSASSAASSASTATTKASEASTSASNAATSATNAASSATSASSSATNAASEAAAALSSKGLALDAQTAAETAESNASDHADDAVKAAYGAIDTLQTLSDSSTLYSARHYASKTGADKTAAAASATAAAASATAAAASEAAAATLFDQFDDKYLGSKSTAPTTDNDGDPLTEGAVYWNSTDNSLNFYTGSAWAAPEDLASTSATNAAASETAAASSASAASTSATAAASSATAAASSATAAAASETAAAASETAAGTSETNAATSASAASTSASNAATSATAAASSATSASTSASTATTQASNASTSATNAAASETAAAASESAAAASESAAASSASTASTQATNAATSASSAASSASTATTKATEASTSATNAATSATAAASSASAASASKDAALAALDNFDDRYLGQKTSDPTVDNDGDALVAGALYFNTTDDVMKVYEGSTWVAAYASLSGALLQANNLSDVQSASAARTNLGLGTAATTASTDYATAAQGAKADSALQNITGESIENLSDVATMTPSDGQLLTWDSVTSKWNAEDAPVSLPSQTGNSGYYLTTNGTSASWDALATVANSGAYSDLSGTPTNVSSFTNDSGYITGNQTITLSGDVTGSGTTSISVTVADDSHNHVISNVDGLQTALDAKQGLDADLTKIAGLSSADGNFIVGSATGWVAESGATARASLGLGSLATLSTVNASTITDNSVGAAELNVTGNGTTSQFLRSDGDGTFTWATPTDTNTTYTASTGLTLTGTAFSVNYGTTSTTACVGNDSRLSNSRTCNNSFDNAATARTNLGLGSLATLSAVGAAQITDNTVGAAELNVSGNGTTSQFLRSDGDGTFTWATPTDTNTTYSAGAGLDLSGTTFLVESDIREYTNAYIGGSGGEYFHYDGTNNLLRGYVNSGEVMRLYSGTTGVHFDGDVIAYSTTISDERLKENIVGIDNALDKVSQLNGYTFTYKADGKISAGVIAQEVEKVLPEAVSEKELGLHTDDDGIEYKVVNYDALHGLLIEAIKELKAEIEALKGAK